VSTRTRARIYDTLPTLLPTMFGDPGTPPAGASDRPEPPPIEAQQQVADFTGSSHFDAWSEALARVGNCRKPIRLVGCSQTIDTATGEVVAETRAATSRSG
jgi:hypothetical protein